MQEYNRTKRRSEWKEQKVKDNYKKQLPLNTQLISSMIHDTKGMRVKKAKRRWKVNSLTVRIKKENRDKKVLCVFSLTDRYFRLKSLDDQEKVE